MVNIANEIFGFSGWSSTVQSLSIDQEEMTADGKFNISMSAIVRITLQDGAFREDVGYGQIANSPSRASAYEKVKKEAVTDSMKRALKAFGPALGNCCYDKDYLTKVSRCSIPKVCYWLYMGDV